MPPGGSRLLGGRRWLGAPRQRPARPHADAVLVHTPVPAGWLNQVEVYCPLTRRKGLAPNDFADPADVERRLRSYAALTNRHPRPFDRRFDRHKLAEFLERLDRQHTPPNPRVDRETDH